MSAISLTPSSYFNIKFENNPAAIFHPGDTMNGNLMDILSSSDFKVCKFQELSSCTWKRESRKPKVRTAKNPFKIPSTSNLIFRPQT